MSETFDQWQAKVVNACVSNGMIKQARFMSQIRDLLAEAFSAGQESSPGYTAVDMTNAARDGFRDGAASKEKIIDALLNHCEDGECHVCSQIICPHGEPLHFHHDGCPACAQDEPE